MRSSLNAFLITTIPLGVAALLFVSVARPTSADEKPAPAGQFFATLEGHYLSNIGEKTRWGTLIDPNSFTPLANLNILPQWGGGGRMGLGYRAGSGWDIAALGDADWLYAGHQQVLITGSAFPFNTPILLNTVQPFFGLIPPNSSVSVDAQATYSYVDIEGGYNMKLGTMVGARLFGGVRYANFDQSIQTNASGVVVSNPFEVVSRREVTYWGVGPRLGGSARLRICESPFYLVSSVSGSVLFGDMRVKDNESISSGFLNAFNVENRMYAARTAYNGEGEIGVLYDVSPTLNGLDITIGYRLSGWFGVNDTRPPNPAFPSGESHANVVTQGTFLRMSFRY